MPHGRRDTAGPCSPERRSGRRVGAGRVAALTAAGSATALCVTLLAGPGAAGAPHATPPTRALPGSAPLSPLASARPATVAAAERQFLHRTPARYRDQELGWAPCAADAVGSAQAAALLECSAVAVPRDWSDPEAGAPLTVAISRVRTAGGERAQRSVLTNPGGPGGPGLSLPAVLGTRPALAGTEVVGVDVRGTGVSSTVTCLPATAELTTPPDPRDRSPEAVAATQDLARRYAQACQQDPLSALVTTEQTVADLDLVRDALDRDTIDWVGYSGGTWLGAQYSTYFPGRVGRFVLDSNTDVTGPFQRIFTEHQPPAFQRRFAEDFQPWAARYSWLFRLGATPAEVGASYERLRADLVARPVVVPLLGLRVDGRVLDALVAQSMYSKTDFEALAWTMRGLRVVSDLLAAGDRTGAERASAGLRGRLAGLLPQGPGAADGAAPAPDAADATFLATTCNDTAWSRGEAFWSGVGERQGSRYPLVGWTTSLQPCGYWNRPALSLPVPDGRDLPPVLLVQTEHDPATSYEGALKTHAALPSSRLVTVAGDGDHGVYGAAGNTCVDELVDAFLTTGAAPAGDVSCATTGVPAPGSQLLGSVDLRDAVTG